MSPKNQKRIAVWLFGAVLVALGCLNAASGNWMAWTVCMATAGLVSVGVE